MELSRGGIVHSRRLDVCLAGANHVTADSAETDRKMMRHCIELSAAAVAAGELPFACIICREGQIVAEATNRVVRDGDATRHAELLALSEVQRRLGRKDLSDCTLFSNVEPCAMCAFAVRETRIRRVVFSIASPMMGGFSKWNVMSDTEISNVMPEVFGDIPEVSAGLLYREAAAVWRKWNPVFWLAIRFRGALAEGSLDAHRKLQSAPHRRRHLLRRLLALYR
jgi:tRNA(adenine34) deaminase